MLAASLPTGYCREIYFQYLYKLYRLSLVQENQYLFGLPNLLIFICCFSDLLFVVLLFSKGLDILSHLLFFNCCLLSYYTVKVLTNLCCFSNCCLLSCYSVKVLTYSTSVVFPIVVCCPTIQ